MDIATIAGLAAAFGLVGFAIFSGAGGLGAFFDVNSIAIVFGGTTGALLMNFPLNQVIGAGKVLKNAFLHKAADPKVLIESLAELANKARREGILALEAAINDAPDEFMKQGIQLTVDGQDPSAIEAILSTEIDSLQDRHKAGADFFSTAATFAPALGLIGTLVGLVQMLLNMSDPDAIGPSMAVALLTTFYGALLANLVFNPISGKLKNRSQEEVMLRNLVLEGVLAITAGDNPRVVEQKLNAFLAPSQRKPEDGKG
jgi:chemotaxis protein MotA